MLVRLEWLQQIKRNEWGESPSGWNQVVRYMVLFMLFLLDVCLRATLRHELRQVRPEVLSFQSGQGVHETFCPKTQSLRLR